MKRITILLLLLLTTASCQRATVFYHPESIGITSVTEEGDTLKVQFAVAERAKFYDCPEVRVEKSKDRINLWFVRKSQSDVKKPVSQLVFANPERLPVYVSNGKQSVCIWPEAAPVAAARQPRPTPPTR
jgi:hypothetical protein